MKLKKLLSKPHGLRARFAISLGASVVLCGLLFFVLYNASYYFLTNYFEQSGFMEAHKEKQEKNLQEYISKNEISSKDLHLLEQWEHRQPIIFLELYYDGKCVYSSIDEEAEREYYYEWEAEDEKNAITIQLTDIEVSAVLLSDFTYHYYVAGTAVSAILAVLLFVFLFLRSNRKIIHYICRLNEEVQILEGGNLEYQVSVEGNDEITDLAKSMNRMRESFQQQMETEQKLHQANRRLVTEMSHDLRTPLTGMMLYLEILRSHRYTTEEELQDYLDKIDAKAHHMKQISDHLFEYSLSEVSMKDAAPQNMQDAFGAIVEDFQDDLAAHGFSVVSEVDWFPYYVDVNEEFTRRIFENIASNIVKYAEPSADVTICTVETEQFCGFSVMNTCSVSGNKVNSSGIGIESIRNMMEQMNGICTTEQTETAFEISVLFPKI